MVPFQIELKLAANPVNVTVEQLDRLADEEGFIRYDVTCGQRRSVILVNVENDLPLPMPQDAETYFEKLHYPEQVSSFSEEEIFSRDEITAIGDAILKYNRGLNTRF